MSTSAHIHLRESFSYPTLTPTTLQRMMNGLNFEYFPSQLDFNFARGHPSIVLFVQKSAELAQDHNDLPYISFRCAQALALLIELLSVV